MFASEEAEDGRYYKKALSDLTEDMLVRDRGTGNETADREPNPDDTFEVDYDEEEDEAEEVEEDAPNKSKQQIEFEADWGLEEDGDGGAVRHRRSLARVPDSSVSVCTFPSHIHS